MMLQAAVVAMHCATSGLQMNLAPTGQLVFHCFVMCCGYPSYIMQPEESAQAPVT
jgi:EamA domain-containing membrane protein RarD